MRLPSILRDARKLLGLGLVAAAGCGGTEGAGGGTVIIASAQDPDNLLPPTITVVQGTAIADNLFEKIADLGPGLNTVGDAGFVPRLSQRWEWSRDSLRLTLHLDPRARWSDGHPVTARDVSFAFAVYTDPKVGARSGGDLMTTLDSITTVDSLTCIAWYKKRSPEQFYQLVTSLIPLPEHLLGAIPHDSLRTSAFGRAPIGDGAFKFVRWDARQRVEIAAVHDFYRGRPVFDRVIWTIAPDAATGVQQFLGGDADIIEYLSPPDAAEAAKHADVRVIPRGNFDYNFLQFNTHDGGTDRPHPLFADRSVRRALTMALDRKAMVKSVLGDGAAVGLGPFVRAQWSADTTLPQIGFDRAAAARLLDSLGWRAGGDGMRGRNGRPLAFSLTVPTSSKNRQAFAVLIQEQLRQAGVRVNIDLVDVNALISKANSHQFDALLGGWVSQPSPSGIRQTWTSAGAVTGGLNYGRYENHAFDAQVDSALASPDAASAKSHYHAAYRIAIDDAPAIWLYEPPQLFGASKRITMGPLRADAWWYGLQSWSIAPGGRLPRDAAPKAP
jgi:peptide/nickel transport system substrate-binding protein